MRKGQVPVEIPGRYPKIKKPVFPFFRFFSWPVYKKFRWSR
jgi:hypothetical protein